MTIRRREGRPREVFDGYCVDPACPCMDAFLHFFQERKGGETVAREEFAATVDLETGAIRGPKLEAIPEARRAMVAAFLDSLGDWSGELRLRRRILRDVAKKRLRFDDSRFDAFSPAPPPSEASSRIRGIPDAAGRPAATWPRRDPDSGTTSRPRGAGLERERPRPAPSSPVVGPSVSPTRNGPCPCGSGRKYKNCCAP